MLPTRMYTKENCRYCDLAKAWFRDRSIEVQLISLDDDKTRMAFYQQYDVESVPQIWIEERWVGGWEALKRLTRTFDEGLLCESTTYKPFRYDWAVELTKRHEKAHWVEDEIDLSEDVAEWKRNLDTSEKEFITHVLRLFTQSDVAVGANYYQHFIPRINNNEVRNMLGSFASREGTHQRSYALLNDTLGLPDSEFHAFMEYQEMTDKMDFMYDIQSSSVRGLALGLARSVMNEGVSLFASFAMLLNFQRFGKMKGMSKVVEWSVRDETMHVEGLTKVYRTLTREHPYVVTQSLNDTVQKMAKAVVELEDRFIDAAFAIGTCQDLTPKQLKRYIRVIMDKRLLGLGMETLWNIESHPIPWLQWIISGADHTNFFENRVTEYEVGGLVGAWVDAYDGPSVQNES